MMRPTLSRRRKHCLILATGFLMSGALLAAPSAFSQDGDLGHARAALRKDPEFARLYHDGKAFLALPAAKQEAMRKLHADLHGLSPHERHRLEEVLTRYADWLDGLAETDRQTVIDAPEKRARLQAIKKLREQEWVARQPKALRQYLDKLPASKPPPAVVAASTVGVLLGTPRQMRPLSFAVTMATQSTNLRVETIARLKRAESRKARAWMIAARHWNELTDPKRPPMPAHAADFTPEVETFVKEYLRPMLEKEELARLDKAEGQWPLFPMTLVELADKHPMALPQKRGPTAFKDLPQDVQKRLAGKMFPGKEAKKKDLDQFFQKLESAKALEARLAAVIPRREQTPAIKFACVVATYAHEKKAGVKLPHELWAARAKDMSVAMRVFLDEKGPFWLQLTPEEHGQLFGVDGKWPEYPLKVQELATKYGFRPPWQALPDIGNKSEVWDKYRLKPQNKVEAPLPAQLQRDVAQTNPKSQTPNPKQIQSSKSK